MRSRLLSNWNLGRKRKKCYPKPWLLNIQWRTIDQKIQTCHNEAQKGGCRVPPGGRTGHRWQTLNYAAGWRPNMLAMHYSRWLWSAGAKLRRLWTDGVVHRRVNVADQEQQTARNSVRKRAPAFSLRMPWAFWCLECAFARDINIEMPAVISVCLHVKALFTST